MVSDPSEWLLQRYRLLARLDGHKGPINCFAFNKESSLLASGGEHHTFWLVYTKQPTRWWRSYPSVGRQSSPMHPDISRPKLPLGPNHMSQIYSSRCCSRLDVLRHRQRPASDLSSSQKIGKWLVCWYKIDWQEQGAEFMEISCTPVFTPGDSVESFCFDSVHYRLIVTSHFGQIKMYEVNAGMLVDLWTEDMSDAIPRATLFMDKGNSVMVYGLETGKVWVLLVFTRGTKGLTHSTEYAAIHKQRLKSFREIWGPPCKSPF